jgi:hypothetical protein
MSIWVPAIPLWISEGVCKKINQCFNPLPPINLYLRAIIVWTTPILSRSVLPRPGGG